MTELIKGKIAKIVTEHYVALNIGSDHGVVNGMKFAIRSPSIPIFDPDSNQKVGEFSFVKARVKVYKVSEKYSLAETYEMESALFAYPTLFKPSRKKLPVDSIDLIDIEEKVKVGDLVEQILEEEEG